MIEIGVYQVFKNFGYKRVLDGVSFEVFSGDRVAIVGKNGSGKSTLFKMIVKQENPDAGSISIRKNASIGYLEQIPHLFERDATTFDVLMEAFSDSIELEQRMRMLEKNMAIEKDALQLTRLLKKYEVVQNQFIYLEGYEIEEKFNRIVTGFNLEELLERPYNVLSGGQKTIVNLAGLILKEPELLLLDEPTNHLDVKTVEWLEGYLSKYRGTVVMISHDRYFLDKIATKTILLEEGQGSLFHGNYSFSLQEKERLLLLEFEQYKNQQKKIVAIKSAIKRFRDWGNQSDNKKFFRKAKELEKRLEKMEVLDKPQIEKTKLPMYFSGNRSSNDVLKIKDFYLSFDDLVVFDSLDLSVHFKEKISLIGDNGSGKSSLIKAILGEITDYRGQIKLAPNVKIGYIPQEIRFDSEEDHVLDAFRKEYPCLEGDARHMLAKYAFYQDNVFKKVKTLSGGEKVLLKLAILIQNQVNFLILDEPTNHVDIETRETLEEALLEYFGTVLFISHDRYFISKLANRVLEINDGKVIDYDGRYDDYRHYRIKNR